MSEHDPKDGFCDCDNCRTKTPYVLRCEIEEKNARIAEREGQLAEVQKKISELQRQLTNAQGQETIQELRRDVAVEIGGHVDTQRELAKAQAEIAELKELIMKKDEALRGLLLSQDCAWEEGNLGHDWADACVAARTALALTPKNLDTARRTLK